jgi:hypothetical protein
MTAILRARRHRLAGRDVVDQLLQLFRRQIFIGVLENLQHRRIHAGAQALHLFPGEVAVFGQLKLVLGDLATANIFEIIGAAQHAGRRAAHLDMGFFAHRLQLEHGVERRHFEHADIGHLQHFGDGTNGRLRQPALMLFLRAPKQRDDRRSLAAFGIFADLLLGPIFIIGRESKAFGLFFVEAANSHEVSLSLTGKRRTQAPIPCEAA